MINYHQNEKNDQKGHKTTLNSQNVVLLTFFLFSATSRSQPCELCEFYTLWVRWLNFMGPCWKEVK